MTTPRRQCDRRVVVWLAGRNRPTTSRGASPTARRVGGAPSGSPVAPTHRGGALSNFLAGPSRDIALQGSLGGAPSPSLSIIPFIKQTSERFLAMGVKTTVAPLVPAAPHLAAALKAGTNASSMQNEIILNINELVTKLTIWVATMQAGDPNIAVVNAQIAALS